jgi:hypothetical protein
VNGRCETCKHWVPFGGKARRGDVYGVMVNGVDRELGLCQKASGVSYGDDGDGRDPTSLAYAEDGSDYRANFRTDGKFGCVMYEAKS